MIAGPFPDALFCCAGRLLGRFAEFLLTLPYGFCQRFGG